MLIRPAELERIKAGDVDLAFRRWDRPRLRTGTRMRTTLGLVEVTSVDRVAQRDITADDARRAGAPSRKALLELLSHRTDPIWRIGLAYAGDDPRVALRNDAELDDATRAELEQRLDRLDAASPRGPWTRRFLALIEANEAVRAPDLAEREGYETVVFKRNVRKLKELGLTESLDVGYRLAPRGMSLLHPR
ncbi:ASCH domain-containing protein [Jatrophihabitans fulvus]